MKEHAQRPPMLPKGWKWSIDRTGDLLSVRLRGGNKLLVYRVITARPFWVQIQLRLFVLVGLWMYVAGFELGNWVYRAFAAEPRESRRNALARSLHGDWDSRGVRIEESA